MNIVSRGEGDVVVFDLEGTITIGAGDVQMREELLAALDQGYKKILLNMERVAYMDSSGVGELLGCFKTVRSRGGALKLLNLSKKIVDLLQITQLLAVFEYFDDEARALASFH
jgi:anti-sigma B factor antagonist